MVLSLYMSLLIGLDFGSQPPKKPTSCAGSLLRAMVVHPPLSRFPRIIPSPLVFEFLERNGLTVIGYQAHFPILDVLPSHQLELHYPTLRIRALVDQSKIDQNLRLRSHLVPGGLVITVESWEGFQHGWKILYVALPRGGEVDSEVTLAAANKLLHAHMRSGHSMPSNPNPNKRSF